MIRTSDHSRVRILERDDFTSSKGKEAKKVAKIAFKSGLTIDKFTKYPKFYEYLDELRHESNTCRVKVYRDNIYIWKGKRKTLITCMPISDIFIKEMREINEVLS